MTVEAMLKFVTLPGIALVLNACAFLLSAMAQRHATRQQRATMVGEIFQGFTTDEEIQKAFYLIEYGKFKYEAGFHGSETERHIDKLLRLFSNAALLWQMGLLPTRDLLPLRYYILRVMRNESVRQYLAFLNDFTARASIRPHPYGALSALTESLERLRDGSHERRLTPEAK